MESIEYIYSNLINKKSAVSVIGLGYVGYPIAKSFSDFFKVVAYDNSPERIKELLMDNNPNEDFLLTADARNLQNAIFHVIAVPTPVDKNHKPEFSPLIKASMTLGIQMKPHSVVVYESTVYPGATEEICVPVLEKYSGLKCGVDFFVAYSPERINPSDNIHTLKNISKIVAGMDLNTTEVVKKVYETIVDKMIPVSSIKVAEAIKIVENCQRDVNVAFMNEISMLLNTMGIDTKDVFCGMDTKWNALKFRPGLVGGHCIAVDPYYLIHIAQQYKTQVPIVIEARRTNSNMALYIAVQLVNKLLERGKMLSSSKVTIFGFTFKENCPDIRNTQVFRLVEYLKNAGIKVNVCDYVADIELVQRVYDISIVKEKYISNNDAIVIAVPHLKYCSWDTKTIQSFLKVNEHCVIVDIKGVYDESQFAGCLFDYISL